MAAKSPTKLDKAKELKRVLAHTKKALIELTEADYITCELGNRSLINFHEGSIYAKYYTNIIAEMRELIKYLELITNTNPEE